MLLNSTSLHFRCHPYERQLVEAMAAESGTSVSDLIRDLIRHEYKRRHGALPSRPGSDPGYVIGRPRKEG